MGDGTFTHNQHSDYYNHPDVRLSLVGSSSTIFIPQSSTYYPRPVYHSTADSTFYAQDVNIVEEVDLSPHPHLFPINLDPMNLSSLRRGNRAAGRRISIVPSLLCGCCSPAKSDSEDDEISGPSTSNGTARSLQAGNNPWGTSQHAITMGRNSDVPVHKMVMYTYQLVPDLDEILSLPYYWGRMDRFKAEKLLNEAPEGTFLLRDSAQPDVNFSVSFRRFGRTLHARIEQSDDVFGFDIMDSNVFSAPSIKKLIENYKDPNRCMYFEPLLTHPLNRQSVFSLQELARGVVAANTRYGEVNKLGLPPALSRFVEQAHYSFPVRSIPMPSATRNQNEPATRPARTHSNRIAL